MGKSNTDSRKKIYKDLIALLLIAMVIEVFIFNNRSFQTAGYIERSLDGTYEVELIGGEFDENGDIIICPDTDYVTLIISGFGYPLNNLRLDAECPDDIVSPYVWDHVCVAECSAFDDTVFEILDPDGTSHFENQPITTITADVVHNVEETHYIYLAPFGNTHKLQITLYPGSGETDRIRIHEMTFNAVRPIKILPLRVLIIFIVGVLVYFSMINPLLWREDCISRKKWKYVLILGLFIAFTAFTFCWMPANRARLTEEFSPYSELSRAIVSGKLYVGEAEKAVSSLEGFSVFWRQDSTEAMFDYALYKGKYYVYFGLLPCVVFYLPYYLFTGKDLPNVYVEALLCVITVALMGRLILNIIKRYYNKTPFAMYLLLWWASAGAMYIPVTMTGLIPFYVIPIISGLDLILAGLCVFLGSREERPVAWRLCLGCICMAAVSLCRPTMLLYSLFVTGCIVWRCVRWLRGMRMAENIKVICAIVAPYVIFAGICMVYNSLRFGSPLDFGSDYNVTTYPIQGVELFIPYVLFRTVYEYLLKPPFIDFGFPMVGYTIWDNVREGGCLMVVDIFKGGLIVSNPFTWSLVLLGNYRKRLNSKGIFWPMVGCLCIGMFLMVYCAVYTSSIYTRYFFEFSFAIAISAFIILMEVYEDAAGCGSVDTISMTARIIAFLLMVSILWGGLQLVPSNPDNVPLGAGNTELWYRIISACRVFG